MASKKTKEIGYELLITITGFGVQEPVSAILTPECCIGTNDVEVTHSMRYAMDLLEYNDFKDFNVVYVRGYRFEATGKALVVRM